MATLEFHMKLGEETGARLARVCDWAGLKLGEEQVEQLARLAEWLRAEAIPAGGLGPHEGERIWPRHVLDSLLFAAGWSTPDPPASLADLGSGVGLPGLPLAVAWRESAVTLVDRAGRRIDLARRAIRVLGLDNVEAMQREVSGLRLRPAPQLVVSRALSAPSRVGEWARGLVAAGGRIVLAGGTDTPPSPAMGEEILAVPTEVLDRPVWLRIMAAP